MIKAHELMAILPSVPQDAYLMFDGDVTVWEFEDAEGYLGEITPDEAGVWRFVAPSKSGDVTIGLQGAGIGGEQAQM